MRKTPEYLTGKAEEWEFPGIERTITQENAMKTLINQLILCFTITATSSSIVCAQIPQIDGTYRIKGGYKAKVVQNGMEIRYTLEASSAMSLLNAKYGYCEYISPNGIMISKPCFHGMFKTVFKDGRVKVGSCRIFPTQTPGQWEMQSYFKVNGQWELENSVSMIKVTNTQPYPPAPDWDRNPKPKTQSVKRQPRPDQPLSSDSDEFQLMPAGLSDLGI